MKRNVVLFALALTLVISIVLFPALVLAQQAAPPAPSPVPLFGNPVLDDLTKLGGALMVVVTLLANVLPKEWSLTRFLARVGTDLRGVSLVPRRRSEDDTLPGTGFRP